jgi:hypothetical protein
MTTSNQPMKPTAGGVLKSGRKNYEG